MDIKLITIDGSTKKTGIAYFIDGEYNTHHLLDFSKEKNMEVRFIEMSKTIWNSLDKYKPNILYIEETYTAKNPQTTKILTRLQGVVYAWCINNDCEFNTIKPTSWRKLLGFKQGKNVKRDELKTQSVDYIFNKYGIKVTDDESDALCIADAVFKMFEDKE